MGKLPAVIQVVDVSKSYATGRQKTLVLDKVSLSVGRGEFVVVMGRSGAGKSTLAQLIGGLTKPDSGGIFVDGHDIANLPDKALAHYRNKQVGFVFQNYSLIPNYSVIDNVTMPLTLRGLPTAARRQLARAALQTIDIEAYEHRRIDSLSGGERQRVAIARALVTQPALLLADEPTGNLDSHNALIVVELFRSLARQHQQTTVMVTHDEQLAARADRIIFIADGKVKAGRRPT